MDDLAHRHEEQRRRREHHESRLDDSAIKGKPWNDMPVIFTFDENGGWWDHVAPPKRDRWGPGTPLVESPFAKKEHVEHTVYDTGSIARFVTWRFKLEKLPWLKRREGAMVAAGGPAPGGLTETLGFPRGS